MVEKNTGWQKTTCGSNISRKKEVAINLLATGSSVNEVAAVLRVDLLTDDPHLGFEKI